MSAPFSVGVEEEYQLVDTATGRLISRAPEVLCRHWSGELQAEMQQTMLEVGTEICASADQLRSELSRLRCQAAAAAAAHGLRIVAAGTHPADEAEAQRRSEGTRYARLAQRLGRVARTDHIFGMHVHVAIPAEVDRLAVIAAVRAYLPHLIALAASSPLYAREDTGFASYRTILAGRLPNSGMPPALPTEAAYRTLVDRALAAGLIPDEASLYWSLRPHRSYPTIEFRAGDVCPRLEDAVSIAALLRALVARAAEHLSPVEGDGATDALLRACEWQAARFGLAARLVDPATGRSEVLGDAVRRLRDELAPTAEALGDGAALAGVERLLGRGNGADPVRRLCRRGAGLAEVIGWLAGEPLVGAGVARRQDQRRPALAAAPE